MTESKTVFPYTGEGEQRIDKFLVGCMPDLSRSRLQGLIKDGFVKVNEKVVIKSGQLVAAGDLIEIRVPPPEPSDLIPENIPLDLIYEDSQLMVINKPAGMVVHPSLGHATGTLVQAALAHAPELEGISGEQRPGIVHRLDKDTSGLILIAKDERTHRWLQDQFRLRKVKKVYIALVEGLPPTPTGRVEASIGRDPSHRKRMAVVSKEKGREAISEYYTLETFPAHTLLEVHPLTGRTHQIRLHMAFIKCPIVADTIYGHKNASIPLARHFLHASRLTVTLPGETMPRVFEAPLPPDLVEALEYLKIHSR